MDDEQFDRDTINENHEMSTQTKDGGPAFPETRWDDITRQEVQWTGMTLRDWLAGQALSGISSRPSAIDQRYIERYGPGINNAFAHKAYALADAMIAAREGGAK